MKIRSYFNGGYNTEGGAGGFINTGGNLTGPLYLTYTPTLPLHAVNKEYVDSVLSNIELSLDGFAQGGLPASSLPAYSGTVSNPEGSNNFTMESSGIYPGLYRKVVVNSKGIITSGTTLLSESDIPSLPWSKLTTGRPSTLTGLGITDAIPLTGGVLTGPLVTHASPVSSKHVATLGYITTKIANEGSSVPVGELLELSVNVTPTGYLLANGSLISKTAYHELFAVIGDQYTPIGTVSTRFGLPTVNTRPGVVYTYIKY